MAYCLGKDEVTSSNLVSSSRRSRSFSGLLFLCISLPATVYQTIKTGNQEPGGIFLKHAVVFDMDGLMFDTERLYCQAWDYAGEKSGLGKTGYMVMKHLVPTGRRDVPSGAGNLAPDIIRRRSRDIHRSFSIDITSRILCPSKGAAQFVTLLKSKRIPDSSCLLHSAQSNSGTFGRDGTGRIFDQIVGGDSVMKSKPDPEIYLYACDLLEMEPADCYALEDSRNGLLAASSAGCRTIMVPDLWQPDEEIKSRVLAILPDLDAVLEYLRIQA